MTPHEIARCLYKPGWADIAKYRRATLAMTHCTEDELAKIKSLALDWDRLSKLDALFAVNDKRRDELALKIRGKTNHA